MHVQRETLINPAKILHSKNKYEKTIFENNITEFDINAEDDITFYNCVFKGIVSFKQIAAREFHFSDCVFEKEVFIFNSDFIILGITNCKFEAGVSFDSNQCHTYFTLTNLKSDTLNINGAYASLQFTNCHTKELNLSYSKHELSKHYSTHFFRDNIIENLKIKSQSCESEILFKGGTFQNINFNGSFNKNIAFKKYIECKNIFIESSSFKNRIEFNEGVFENIYFHRSYFHGLVKFWGYDIIESNYENLTVKEISLHSSVFEQDFSIDLRPTTSINLSNCNFHHTFSLNNYYNGTDVNFLTDINIGGSNHGNISFENLFADLHLTDINFGNIYFKNLNTNTIYINKFHNTGNISFSDLKYGVFLIISSTVIGNLYFFNKNLNEFKEIVISDSNLKGLILSNYPKKIKSFTNDPKQGYGLKDKSYNHQNLKSVYNQLKQIAKGNGDIDAFSRYQALEYKELLLTKRISFDTILLTLNWISNNNGNSWLRGILFTLGIAYLFFLLYMKQLGQPLFTPETYKDYILYIGSFPKMKIEDFNHLNGIWNITLIIWLSKIFISYGIYQTISAFRKYGKK